MEVPPALRTAFEEWDEGARQPQPAFEWDRGAWERWLPEFIDVLQQFPNPIDRAAVTPWFAEIDDEDTAVNAYLASYVWGYAGANFGPYRAQRVITSNATFRSDLVEFAKVAQNDGGLAAFEYVVSQKAGSSAFFKFYRPAFATKFIYFATKARPDMPTTPVMDSVICGWFADNVPEVPLYPSWSSANSYRRYVDCAQKWADQLGIEVDDVERLIFKSHDRRHQRR